MVHLSSQNQPIQRLAVARGSKCVTPPKLQLKRSIPAVAGECSKVQKRSFKPLRPAIEPTSICVSPQKKRLRLNQLTPKKVRRLDEMVVNPPSSSKCLTSSFISLGSEDDPILFDIGDAENGGTTSPPAIDEITYFTDEELNDSPAEENTSGLAGSIEHIENSQRIQLPQYLELLQWNPASYARITRRCYILQDWSPRHKTLKVW